MFVAGREALANVVEDCSIELEKMEKTYGLIYDSDKFFKQKAKINKDNLDNIMKDIKFEFQWTTLSCKDRVDEMMSGYDHRHFFDGFLIK